MRRWPFVLLVALTSGVAAQEPRPTPYVERVDVRVRSVLVFITDSQDKPLATAPAPSDLNALDNGHPLEVIAIERVRRTPAPDAVHVTPSEVPGAPPSPSTLRQYLYLDTATLNFRTIPLLTKAFTSQLDGFLAIGPLEIVGADPEPRVLLASTTDAERIRETLRALPTTLPGKERLLQIRRDSLQGVREAQDRTKSAAAGSVRAHLRMAVTEEITLLRHSLERLETWAAARSDSTAGILYYANDGFDADPVEMYRNSISSQDPEMRRDVETLAMEYGREVPRLLAGTQTVLAGKGLTTVPLVLGSTTAEYAGNAANFSVRGAAALRRPTDSAPVFFYMRPLEPLGWVADATGGQVVSATSQLPKMLDSIANAYLVSFRVRDLPDGRPHAFAITAARKDLKVRATRHLLSGQPSAISRQRALRVLEGSEKPTDIPVVAALDGVKRPSSGPANGMLRIGANLRGVLDVLPREGPTRLRLALAVGLSNGEPFTSSEEVDWSEESTSLRYQIPLTWPPQAVRLAIVVEDVSTSMAGAAVVDIPAAH